VNVTVPFAVFPAVGAIIAVAVCADTSVAARHATANPPKSIAAPERVILLFS
jgi:hypothetical protein